VLVVVELDVLVEVVLVDVVVDVDVVVLVLVVVKIAQSQLFPLQRQILLVCVLKYSSPLTGFAGSDCPVKYFPLNIE
jgi:hypothetical protein